MDNYKKNSIPRNLKTKLNYAIENEFYYEAIFIEYAILENILESLLKHAKINVLDEFDHSLNLDAKLKIIKNSPKFKDGYIKTHLSKDLMEKIYTWQQTRKDLNLIDTNYDNNEVKQVALLGDYLVYELNNRSTLINKYNDNIIRSKIHGEMKQTFDLEELKQYIKENRFFDQFRIFCQEFPDTVFIFESTKQNSIDSFMAYYVDGHDLYEDGPLVGYLEDNKNYTFSTVPFSEI